MFTEDYVMRMINQALAALMIAIGLRKAGKYSEALQGIQQSIEQLMGLPASMIDQMDDSSLLSMLTAGGQLDTGRLAVLSDLYQEQGANFFKLNQPVPGIFAYTRALRFNLEVVLTDESQLLPETMLKINTLVQKLDKNPLGIDTQLALADYYRRILDMDDPTLLAAGASRKTVEGALASLQSQIDSSTDTIGH
jgi:hypothetical protein